MSKAEELAGKYIVDLPGEWQSIAYYTFLDSYEQAEKDLALTWEDIRTIFSLLDETARLLWFQNKKFNDKELCEETLRKFNEAKESKQ